LANLKGYHGINASWVNEYNINLALEAIEAFHNSLLANKQNIEKLKRDKDITIFLVGGKFA
jgi:hypothetical protein